MKFWLDEGVDGFRVDAVPYLVEREGTSCENLDETHEVLRWLRRRIDEEYPDGRVLLAEANMWPEEVRPYFGDGDEFHMAFHFPVMPRMFMAVRLEDRKPLVDILERTPEHPAGLSVGHLPAQPRRADARDGQRHRADYMLRRATRRTVARVNVGIRRRLAPLLEGDMRRIELLNGMLMALPGSPFLYYGDEIGMGDNVYLGDRNGVRTPMQWSGGWNGGFSTADPERLYLPLISNPIFGYQSVNVEPPASRRRAHSSTGRSGSSASVGRLAVFGRGHDRVPEARPTTGSSPSSAAYDGETVLVVFNLAGSAQAVELDLARWPAPSPSRCSAAASSRGSARRPYVLTLGPYDFFWFKLRWL